MKRFIKRFSAAVAVLPLSVVGAAQTGACTNGRLIDVQVNTVVIDGGTAEHVEERSKKNGREYHSYSTPLNQQQTIYTVTVQFDDLIYTAQSQSVFGLGFKPTSFVVNDPIHGCVRGSTLALTRQDGKEFKARIVRAERTTIERP